MKNMNQIMKGETIEFQWICFVHFLTICFESPSYMYLKKWDSVEANAQLTSTCSI